jgi:hypothetical protein
MLDGVGMRDSGCVQLNAPLIQFIVRDPRTLMACLFRSPPSSIVMGGGA